MDFESIREEILLGRGQGNFKLKGPQTDFSRVAKEVKCYFR